MTSSSRASRSGYWICVFSTPKPRDLKSENKGSDPNAIGPGKTFESSVTDAFRAKGDQVFEQVRVMPPSGKYSVVDQIVVRNGRIRLVVDSKSGSPRLRGNQPELSRTIAQGGKVSFTGPNASGIPGMTTGSPITLPVDSYKVVQPGQALP